jgi:SAM-dependent methyltransferase
MADQAAGAPLPESDELRAAYSRRRAAHWDSIARRMDVWQGGGGHYHRRLAEIYRTLVEPGLRVLEIGCGRGDLLARLEPSYGVGVDFSSEMIRRAGARHPQLTFVQADAHALPFTQTFDVIILSDLASELWDVQGALAEVMRLSSSRTRVILNSYSRLWQAPLMLTKWLNLSKPVLDQNWLTVEDLRSLLALGGLEAIRSWSEILLPLRLPLIDSALNRVAVRFWPFHQLALTNFLVGRRTPRAIAGQRRPSVTVVVPARNEAGNIPPLMARMPRMGDMTELIFVEGHSTDDTFRAIEYAITQASRFPCRLLRQPGRGKGDAVRCGFAQARGEVLMILDADLSVPPEDLVRFYDALVSGVGELINGVRMVYPMEDQAMRFLNLLGNKSFSMFFSWLIGQPVKDTLCGTKVLWRPDYEEIARSRSSVGDVDPFGDFDLLFGAARRSLKIVDLPVRYRSRAYGTTNIQRWRHGWLLMRMAWLGMKKLKFV